MKNKICLKLLITLIIFQFIGFPLVTSAKIEDSNIRSVVQIYIYDSENQLISSGSGVSIGGLRILTNYHVAEEVIKNPDDYVALICYMENSQSEKQCDVLASNSYNSKEFSKELDLAILLISYKKDSNGKWKSMMNMTFNEFPSLDSIDPLTYGYNMSEVSLGDEVQTLGFPDYGHDTMTYSNGVVSNFWMNNNKIIKNYKGILAIGTSARISHGSSGGAAFDKNGKFLGITSSGIVDDNGNFLTGVIIPVTVFNWWWRDVLEQGVNSRLGYTNITDEVLDEVYCNLSNGTYDKVLKKCNCDVGYVLDKNGLCNQVSDGTCGSLNKSNVGVNSLTSTSLNLCSSGKVANFQIWNGNYWWKCSGISGAKSSDWCTSYIKNQVSDGTCGSLNKSNVGVNSLTSASLNLCSSGKVANFQIWNGNYWWKCSGNGSAKSSDWCTSYIKK